MSYINMDKDQFVAEIQKAYDSEEEVKLVDGYAPFCKHIFVKNFTDSVPAFIKITPENQHFLVSGYEARNEKELPVLGRWFDLRKLPQDTLKKASYLNIILYSRDQCIAEAKATGTKDSNENDEYDYGIVSVKAQDVNYSLPMQPITAMRNCLGKEEGGSGVPLDKEKYLESVKFWQEYATAKLSEDPLMQDGLMGKHINYFTEEREKVTKNFSDVNFWGTESQLKPKSVDELLGELSD